MLEVYYSSFKSIFDVSIILLDVCSHFLDDRFSKPSLYNRQPTVKKPSPCMWEGMGKEASGFTAQCGMHQNHLVCLLCRGAGLKMIWTVDVSFSVALVIKVQENGIVIN